MQPPPSPSFSLARARRFALGVSVLFWGGVSAAAGSALPQIKVGDQQLPAQDVAYAVEQCAANLPEESSLSCLQNYWVPRWLLDAAAAQKNLGKQAAMTEFKAELLHDALLTSLANKVPAPSAEQVAQFIKKHPRDFNKPLRLRIFRILVRDQKSADEVLKKLKLPLTPGQFRELAREFSIDEATNERGGDLGFVWPDGSTDVPQVSADPQLYKAAQALKEGEFLSSPVQEGKHLALIWRRGSLPSQENAQLAQQQATALLKEKAAAQQQAQLLSQLEKKFVKNRNDQLLHKLRGKDSPLFIEP